MSEKTRVNAPDPKGSPRERILQTAADLFYQHGIQATGVGELAGVAGVSKRTLYQLFGSKDELIAAYLNRMVTGEVATTEDNLTRDDLSPRERMLALFDRPRIGDRFRGCPFHNAAVEITDPGHPAREVIGTHKRGFLRQLVDTAGQAGASDPETLGRQLFTLFEGAMALATTLDDIGSFDLARPAAEALLDNAIPGRTT